MIRAATSVCPRRAAVVTFPRLVNAVKIAGVALRDCSERGSGLSSAATSVRSTSAPFATASFDDALADEGRPATARPPAHRRSRGSSIIPPPAATGTPRTPSEYASPIRPGNSSRTALSGTASGSRRRRRPGAPRSGDGGFLRLRPSRRSGDLLAGRDLRAVLDRVGESELAAPAVVGPQRHVAVDGCRCTSCRWRRRDRACSRRATRSCATPPCPPRRRARRTPRGALDVDPGMPSVDPRVAVVVEHRASREQREDDRLARARPSPRLRPMRRGRRDRDGEGEEENHSSGCRPVAEHAPVRRSGRAGH